MFCQVLRNVLKTGFDKKQIRPITTCVVVTWILGMNLDFVQIIFPLHVSTYEWVSIHTLFEVDVIKVRLGANQPKEFFVLILLL